jgi:CelD/BcsL family acetyltransferase involved in cellulose biosynthesis
MINYRLTTPDKLSPAELAAWNHWQSEQRIYESPYFRPEFTRLVAQVRTDVEVAVLEKEGRTVGFFPFQRDTLNFGKPIGGKLNDFHGVVTAPNIEVNATELLTACRLASWDFDHLIGNQKSFDEHVKVIEEAPYIDLTQGFAGYCEARKQAGTEVIRKTISRGRKFQREVGDIAFEWHNTSPAVLQTLIDWKIQQFHRTGFMNLFAFDWTSKLLQKIIAEPTAQLSAVVSVLWHAEKPLAIAYQLRSFDILHAWFIAYDQQHATYSPGMTLFLKIAEEAATQGIKRIHLGAGDQRFKQSLGSGFIPVSVGEIEARTSLTSLRHLWRNTREIMAQQTWLSFLQKPLESCLQPMRRWIAFR